MKPLVSVLTATTPDREWYLNRCQLSVQAQTLPPRATVGDGWTHEHIVVDGDREPHISFGEALEQAQGSLIMCLSDDDWLAPHALETLIEPITHSGAEWATAQTLVTNTATGEHVIAGGQPNPALLQHTYYLGGAVMFTRDLYNQVGGWDPEWSHCMDYDLYWRFAKVAEAVYIPDVLYFYTDHPQTDSHQNDDLIADQIRRLRTHHAGRTP